MDKKDVLKQSSIYVIAVCRNENQYIAPFIKSISASTIPVEIVLVDNASDTPSREKLKDFSNDAVILWQDKNLGFGIANNVGIKYALEHGAEYIFLLNMDMLIEPGTIEALLQVSKKNPDFAIISPLCLNFEKNMFEKMFFQSLSKANMLYNEDARLFFTETYLQKAFSKELYESSYINAAHWFMPADIIQKTGGFNPVFYPIYGEDEEFLNRLVERGLKLGFTPKARVFHDTEFRPPSTVLKYHATNINYYVKLLKSKYWQIYYFYVMIFALRILKNLLLFRKENCRHNFFSALALIRWKKILKSSWRANRKKESIGLHCDISPECIPRYLKPTK